MNEGMKRRRLWKEMEISNEQEFLSCSKRIEVENHAAVEFSYTWNNKREGKDFIAKKLDRVMINQHWLSACPQCIVKYLPHVIHQLLFQ